MSDEFPKNVNILVVVPTFFWYHKLVSCWQSLEQTSGLLKLFRFLIEYYASLFDKESSLLMERIKGFTATDKEKLL